MLITIGDHGSATVPSPLADDMDRGRQEGVGVTHDRADVEVVLPVLDGNVKWVTAGVEVGDDRLARPVPISIDHIATVTVRQEVGIEPGIVGPRFRVGPDPYFVICHRTTLGADHGVRR